MRSPINKRIYRQFKYKPHKVIPVLIVLSFIVIFASSFFISQESVKRLYYKQMNEGKVEDGEFQTVYELKEDVKKKVEDLGVKLYDNYYFDADVDSEKTLRIFKTREKINIAQLLEGSLASKADQISLSANFARNNGIHVNDKIRIFNKDYTVTALISLPDYSSLLKNRNDIVMDIGYFGTALLSEKAFDDIKENEVKYLYSYHTDADLNKKEAKDKLKDITKLVSEENIVMDAVTRYDNNCISYVMDDMDGDVPTMTISIAIMFIAVAFISGVQVKSTIEEEAPIIGTLLASGYRKKELLFNYMAMPLFIVLVSAALGNLAAYTYTYKIYASAYYKSFELPAFEVYISPRSFIITSIMPFVLYLLINLFIIFKSLKTSPVNFLRRNLTKSKTKSRFKFKGMGFIRKFKRRVVLANKSTYISLIFASFIANLLLIFALSAKPIFNNYAEDMKNKMKYEHTYIVKGLEDFDAVKATMINVELVEDGDKSVQVFGLGENTKYDYLSLATLKDDEVIISKGLAKRFNYAKNDTIKVREAYNSEEKNLKIKGIDEENNYLEIFTNTQTANKIIGADKDYYNAYLSDKKLDISKDNIVTEINKDEMTKFMKHFLSSFSAVIDTTKVVALIFYFILIFIATELIIDRNRLNMTYLKIFGYKDKELSKIYVNTGFIVLIAFQILSIPLLDKLIKYLFFEGMQKFDAYVQVQVPVKIYIISNVMTIVIFIICQIIERMRISKLDLVKELKVIAG